MIVLRSIDGYNYRRVIELSVAEDQRDFVADNVHSLAQAYAMPECRPVAVYEGMQPVGFAMYALDADDGEYWIYRFMIDQRFQRRGYGREALRLLIARIRAEAPDRRVLYLSYAPENAAALALYSSFGFVPDGRMVDGEIVLRLAL